MLPSASKIDLSGPEKSGPCVLLLEAKIERPSFMQSRAWRATTPSFRITVVDVLRSRGHAAAIGVSGRSTRPGRNSDWHGVLAIRIRGRDGILLGLSYDCQNALH
jgi:hypothetical protein